MFFVVFTHGRQLSNRPNPSATCPSPASPGSAGLAVGSAADGQRQEYPGRLTMVVFMACLVAASGGLPLCRVRHPPHQNMAMLILS